MGEIAEDMTDGFACSGCGVYFMRCHGFPVLCRECYGGDNWDCEIQDAPNRATIPEIGDSRFAMECGACGRLFDTRYIEDRISHAKNSHGGKASFLPYLVRKHE